MTKQKKLKKFAEEAYSIRSNTRQMLSGNLDIKIDTEHFAFLEDLAEDINQINYTFNAYINEISHILSHLSAGNMAVAFSKDVLYQGDFLPIKNALHKIRQSLNSSFTEIHKLSMEIDAMSNQVEAGSSFLAESTKVYRHQLFGICQLPKREIAQLPVAEGFSADKSFLHIHT